MSYVVDVIFDIRGCSFKFRGSFVDVKEEREPLEDVVCMPKMSLQNCR